MNVYRPFYSPWYQNDIFAKPRFRFRNDELFLLKNPLSSLKDYEQFLLNDRKIIAKLGEDDYHYQVGYLKGPFDFLPSVRFIKVFLNTLSKRVSKPIFTPTGLYNTESEAFIVTAHLFDAFYRDVLKNGALPVILIYPDLNDQRRSRDNCERRYTPLLDHFKSKDYFYIDTLDALEQYNSNYAIENFVVNWGHLSPLASQISPPKVVA